MCSGCASPTARIPLQGAIAFAPSFDTAGWFARDAALFARVGRVLLADDTPARSPARLLVATDAFQHANAETAAALAPAVARIAALIGSPQSVPLTDGGLDAWMSDFRVIQAFEIWATLGAWVGGLDANLGGGIRERFAWASTVTQEAALEAAARRMLIRVRMDALLADDAVLALPTVVGIAPLRGTATSELEAWRNRNLGLLCIAGHAGLPQINLPLASHDGCPLGLSLLAGRGNDTLLLEFARRLDASKLR